MLAFMNSRRGTQALVAGQRPTPKGSYAVSEGTLARIDRVSARVEAGEGVLGRLLVDSTLAVRAEGVLEQLDFLLKDLRENPKRYVRLSIF